jgi:citrate lyase alpha subunit
MSYYEENLKKMAERNRTDKEKHKKHSEFMKDKTYSAKQTEYDGKVYKSMTEAIEKTGLSRYLILKKGGKFINKKTYCRRQIILPV